MLRGELGGGDMYSKIYMLNVWSINKMLNNYSVTVSTIIVKEVQSYKNIYSPCTSINFS